jgi:hypothetical protein
LLSGRLNREWAQSLEDGLRRALRKKDVDVPVVCATGDSVPAIGDGATEGVGDASPSQSTVEERHSVDNFDFFH